MNRTVTDNGRAFECLLRYDYLMRGKHHDVQLQHKGGKWCILVDGHTVFEKAHQKVNPLRPAKHSLTFQVGEDLEDATVMGTITATWVISSTKWKYQFRVNDQIIPPAWTREERDLGSRPFELFPNSSETAQGQLVPEAPHEGKLVSGATNVSHGVEEFPEISTPRGVKDQIVGRGSSRSTSGGEGTSHDDIEERSEMPNLEDVENLLFVPVPCIAQAGASGDNPPPESFKDLAARTSKQQNSEDDHSELQTAVASQGIYEEGDLITIDEQPTDFAGGGGCNPVRCNTTGCNTTGCKQEEGCIIS